MENKRRNNIGHLHQEDRTAAALCEIADAIDGLTRAISCADLAAKESRHAQAKAIEAIAKAITYSSPARRPY